MKEIELTQGCKAIVDDEDYELVSKFKWYPRRQNDVFYATRNNTKREIIKVRNMHRLILGMDSKSTKQVDHINGDGLDNRRKNLRVCSPSQNQCNYPGRKLKRISKYKGVHFRIRYGKYKIWARWIAQIQKDRNKIMIGHFSSESDAAKAYNSVAKKLHGDFAYFNSI